MPSWCNLIFNCNLKNIRKKRDVRSRGWVKKDSSLTVDDSLIIKIINTRNTNPRRFIQPQIPLELEIFLF